VLHGLRRVTGIDLLADLSTFFGLLGDMTGDFSRRATQVERMLRADTTAFLLITSAQNEPIDEAIWFHHTLVESGFPFSGVVVNRVHHDLLGDREPEDLLEALDSTLRPELAERVGENFRDYHVLACRDEHNIARLAQDLPGRPLLVPHFDDDVHDIEGLLRVHRYLFASTSERERLIADVVA
jgi:anion-transporting  ArsA/GET3 family ATPase